MVVMVGQESDDGEVGDGPIVANVDVEAEGRGQRRMHGVEFVKFANDRSVLERLTGIFAGGWARAQTFFSDRNIEIKGRIGKRRGSGIETQLKRACVRVGGLERGEKKARDGVRGRGTNLFTRVGPAASYELNAPVDDHLRRVDAATRQSVGIVVLTNGEIVGRIGIAPAEMVPIIDMFFERDDLDALERLLVAELLQQ